MYLVPRRAGLTEAQGSLLHRTDDLVRKLYQNVNNDHAAPDHLKEQRPSAHSARLRVTSAHNQRLCHQVSSFLGPAADAQAEVTQGCPLLGPAPSGLGNCDQWGRSTPDCCESPVTNSRSRVLSAWVSGTDQEAVGVSATGTAMSK